MRILIFYIVIACCIGFRIDILKSFKSKSATKLGGLKLSKYWRFETALENPYRPTRHLQTKTGKAGVIEKVRNLLEGTCMLMGIPIMGVKTSQLLALKKGLPEGTVAKVIKNRLLAVAINGTQFQSMIPLCTGENMYLFIPPDINKEVYDHVMKWMKENKRKEGPIAVALEGQAFHGPQLAEIAQLPPKQTFVEQFLYLLMQNIQAVEQMYNIIIGKEPVVPASEGKEAEFIPEEDGQRGLEMLLDLVHKRQAEMPKEFEDADKPPLPIDPPLKPKEPKKMPWED